jgi:hypothetical protein
MNGSGHAGGTPDEAIIRPEELELVGRLAARALLSTGAGEGPVQADERLYGAAIAAMVGELLPRVAAAAGMSPAALFSATFGGQDASRLTRQELLDTAAVRIELLLRGLI